jgi:hypothetical protein
MPYLQHQDGLYLLKQKSLEKGVDHYGIMDVGNRLRHPQVNGLHPPTVIHQAPPSIRLDWLQDTGTWEMLGRITNEGDAIDRLNIALKNPTYDLFGHNCEHFARYVATGKKESTQIQAVGLITGLVALAFLSAN